MDAEQFIERLKREQAQLALASLTRPNGRDAFEFGLLCGMTQAYDRMLTLLKEQQDEADGKPRQENQRPSVRSNPYLEELDRSPLLPEQMGRRR